MTFVRFLLICSAVYFIQKDTGAQDLRSGMLPALNLSTKLSGLWKVNFKSESRILTLNTRELDRPEGLHAEYALTDFSLVISRKIGLGGSLAGGYLHRMRASGASASRFVQQYTLVTRSSGLRLAHRFSSDQTFEPNEPATIRLRYRLATEFSLQGQAVDAREWYLKISNELLSAWEGTAHDFEGRVVPTLGYAITDSNKLETAIDYRLEGLRSDRLRHTVWWAVTWYVSL